MSIELWLAISAASAVLLVIPGPTILLVMSNRLGQGWRAALQIAVGVALVDFWTQMAIFPTTLLTLAFLNAAGYALAALRARNLVQNPRAFSIFSKTGGGLPIDAGVMTVTSRGAAA